MAGCTCQEQADVRLAWLSCRFDDDAPNMDLVSGCLVASSDELPELRSLFVLYHFHSNDSSFLCPLLEPICPRLPF